MTQHYTLSINGENIRGDNGSFAIHNPANQELLGFAPKSTPEQVQLAVAAARAAQPAWAALDDATRKSYISRVAEALTPQSRYLAAWITREQGKPLAGLGASVWGADAQEAQKVALQLQAGTSGSTSTARFTRWCRLVGSRVPAAGRNLGWKASKRSRCRKSSALKNELQGQVLRPPRCDWIRPVGGVSPGNALLGWSSL